MPECPRSLLTGGASTPWVGSAGAPRQDAAAPHQPHADGGGTGCMRVRQRLQRAAGEDARPRLRVAHLGGGEVALEARQGRVVSNLREQPHIARLGRQELEVIWAPAALQIPRPDAHPLILPDNRPPPTGSANIEPAAARALSGHSFRTPDWPWSRSPPPRRASRRGARVGRSRPDARSASRRGSSWP